MDEFGLIKKYLAPLAKAEGAFALTDDAAVFSCSEGKEIVVAKDTIVEGVHFLENTKSELIAKKLMRVNLSDMAAMGAVPKYYLLSLCLPKNTKEGWIRNFSNGLKSDQKEFGVTLLGGDTVSHDGKLILTITMIGEVKSGKAIRRNGAKVGDDIYVSGTVGDAAFGLKCLESRIENRESSKLNNKMVDKYLLPQPRISLGQGLSNIANSAIDISDGLLADLEHICDCSGVGALINRCEIPISEGVKQHIDKQDKLWDLVLAGGDDYELVFTANKKNRLKIRKIADKTGIMVTRVGEITRKKGLVVLNDDGESIKIKHTGYKHI